ncbi:MAG: hypothetical protein MZU95_01560 [Desulfomicrobium escambiense]|nr:hypothetical protein [Desulfomicrobium escambiense]
MKRPMRADRPSPPACSPARRGRPPVRPVLPAVPGGGRGHPAADPAPSRPAPDRARSSGFTTSATIRISLTRTNGRSPSRTSRRRSRRRSAATGWPARRSSSRRWRIPNTWPTPGRWTADLLQQLRRRPALAGSCGGFSLSAEYHDLSHVRRVTERARPQDPGHVDGRRGARSSSRRPAAPRSG